MISHVVLCLGLFLLQSPECHPKPQFLRLPDINRSTPEEVNSLESQEPIQSRSFDSNPNKNNVEITIREVENIIKSDPNLPRLTRGEILDLLDNITKEDAQKTKKKPPPRDPKAIMLVMPYTPSKDEKNMADLYTKAPVTQMVGVAEPFSVKEAKPQRRRPSVKYTNSNDITRSPVTSTTTTASTTRSRRRRPQVTTTSTEKSVEYEVATTRPRGRRPIRRKSTSQTSTTTQHPNHRYPDVVANSGIRIVESPNLVPAHRINEDLSYAENTRNEVTWQEKTTTEAPGIEDIIPESLKSVMQNMNLDKLQEPKNKIPSVDEQKKIKNMLASIGMFAETTTTTTTTTTAMPNAESVAESLSPEMRDLLMSFGLLPNPNEKPVTNAERYNPETAEVKADSYVGFKPLPDDSASRDDMDALLASFGLGRSARREKSFKREKSASTGERLTLDMIPDNLKGVISDLGLDNVREAKKIRSDDKKQHVFNPDTQYASEEELKKLEKLMSVIKQLEKLNGTATEEDLKKIDFEGLKELVKSLNHSTSEADEFDLENNYGPDPNKFDDAGLAKNEVKRQESTTTTESSSTTTTEEAKNPSISDLEASFGGQTEASTEAPETTTHRKNGFYHLVDWNTFLDIDDTKGRTVNLRLQPKFGDPKRFYSVTVP